MNKSILKSTTLIIMSMLLAACLGQGSKSEITEPKAKASLLIDTVNFQLPTQLGMKIVKQNQSPQGSLFVQWNVADLDDTASPVRLIYQRVRPAVDAQKLRAQLLSPYMKNCRDVQNTEMQLQSQYQPHTAVEVICAQYGTANYGSLSQVAIFSDEVANHIILTEVKTPVSSKAGSLSYQDAQQQQQVQTSIALIKVMYELIQGTRLCDAQKNCL